MEFNHNSQTVRKINFTSLLCHVMFKRSVLQQYFYVHEYFNVINHSKKGLSFREITAIYHALDIKTRQSAVGASTILYVLRRNTGRSAIIMFAHAY